MKGLSHSLANIVKNPIILSVATALIFSLFEIPVPMTIKRFLGYLSDLALPLALITIGGTLTYHGMMHKGTLALSASFIKLLILPLAGVTVFYKLGYRGDDLGMTFLILGAPTAVTSHVMAESMENDGGTGRPDCYVYHGGIRRYDHDRTLSDRTVKLNYERLSDERPHT